MPRSFAYLPFAAVALGVALACCAQEEYPTKLWEAQHPASPLDASTTPPPAGSCTQVSAQPLPQRLVAISDAGTVAASKVYVSDLYGQFQALCGNCHGTEPGQGQFVITSSAQFTSAMTGQDVLRHVRSNGPGAGFASLDPLDPDDPMPPLDSPTGKPYSQRSPSDPYVLFVNVVQQWLAAGEPAFFVPGEDGGAAAGSATSFALAPAAGDSMTNIGSCIPDPALVAQASVPGGVHDRAVQLDAMFANAAALPLGPGTSLAQLIGLPEHLSDTDLTSLDSAELAKSRVVAYQPTYPLWSDDAGKLRYVRVPLGQSIQFNKDTQEFIIPENTRFYKTFLRKIVDTDGSIRWRKIETRLIVSRHDTSDPNPNVPIVQNALFGTYRWNDSETDATLIENPLRDGLPFTDTLILYDSDEQIAADVLAQNPSNPEFALVSAQAGRHYAIPSSKRCIECHQGSPGQDFILGLRPVQLKRRAVGTGGTLVEPGQAAPGADEMTQLQRFIDYGVVTGIASPDDVLPLEASEGARAPRNDYELTAQGYMLGNCAHCHNPRGYPSVQFPVLAPVLNFLASPNGGVFQMPLEKYSPRITRGDDGNTQIPYITPSLTDSSAAWSTGAIDVYAPWRSLIYRNVDSPFTYVFDSALFPHMPFNTPGYDCRAKQVMSDWMVSIPAVRKNPQIPEYPASQAGPALDTAEQPYVEVAPGSPAYDDAVRAAQARLSILHTGFNPTSVNPGSYSRYRACPDTFDILDPAVVRDPTCHPVPLPPTTAEGQFVDPDGTISGTNAGGGIPLSELTALGVPEHAHWVNTDLTEPAVAWSPRRNDWANILIEEDFPPSKPVCGVSVDSGRLAVPLLQTIKFDEPVFHAFATTPFPMGLWQKKAGCNFSSQRTVSGVAAAVAAAVADSGSSGLPSDDGTHAVNWLFANPTVQTQPSDPVYDELPGEAVFNNICVNCHGPNADGTGRLADNLATMTGGGSIVANLRDGLFGPVGSTAGSYRQAVFATDKLPADADADWTGATVDERAARYLAWMGLGGTEVTIPTALLQIVGNTPVLGERRAFGVGASANMLSVAKTLCTNVLETNVNTGDESLNSAVPWFTLASNGAGLQGNHLLIANNGDAELWLNLCTLNNPPPIQIVDGHGKVIVSSSNGALLRAPRSTFKCDSTPCQVGNDRSGVDTVPVDSTGTGIISPDNRRPWCLAKYWHSKSLSDPPPENPDSAFTPPKPVGEESWPYCPDAFNGAPPYSGVEPLATVFTDTDRDNWTTRGAANAGMAVFVYLDKIGHGTLQPLPSFDQCQLLQ